MACADKSDPFLNARFGRDRLEIVTAWQGFEVGQQAELKEFVGPVQGAGEPTRGFVIAIGLHALDARGEAFTVIRMRFGHAVYDLSSHYLRPVSFPAKEPV